MPDQAIAEPLSWTVGDIRITVSGKGSASLAERAGDAWKLASMESVMEQLA